MRPLLCSASIVLGLQEAIQEPRVGLLATVLEWPPTKAARLQWTIAPVRLPGVLAAAYVSHNEGGRDVEVGRVANLSLILKLLKGIGNVGRHEIDHQTTE